MRVVKGAPDRVNILRLEHDISLCQTDVKMTNNMDLVFCLFNHINDFKK